MVIQSDAIDTVLLSALVLEVYPEASAAPPSGTEMVTGIDYVAGMGAGAPVRATKAKEKYLGAQVDETNPNVFYCRFKENKHKIDLAPVVDQKACGCCYAIAVAQVLGDRYSVSNGGVVNPHPSWSAIVSCLKDADGCSGGSCEDAANYAVTGLVSTKCLNYDWCTKNKNCQGKLKASRINAIRPKCGKQKDNIYRTYDKKRCSVDIRADDTGPNGEDAVMSVTKRNMIKSEIYIFGPIIATFRVFADFLLAGGRGLPKKQQNWTNTKGIYCHVYDRDGGSDVDGHGMGKDKEWIYKKRYGGHAVSIVGWGIYPVASDLKTSDGKPIFLNRKTVPYWIVRNSWGKKWMQGGYFKMAMADKKEGVNTATGLDTGWSTSSLTYGGCTAFYCTDGMKSKNKPTKKIVKTTKKIVKTTKKIVSKKRIGMGLQEMNNTPFNCSSYIKILIYIIFFSCIFVFLRLQHIRLNL